MNRFLRLVTLVVATASYALVTSAQTTVRAVVSADRTNVRAQPSTDAEILASLSKGQVVEVVGEVMPPRSTEAWSRIRMPAAVSVWALAPLVDAKKGEVRGTELRYRAGPGVNYSILGELKKGDPVRVIRNLNGWVQIETPTNAMAYIASRLLEADFSDTVPDATALTSRPPAAAAPAPTPTVQRTPVPPSASAVPPPTIIPPTTNAAPRLEAGPPAVPPPQEAAPISNPSSSSPVSSATPAPATTSAPAPEPETNLPAAPTPPPTRVRSSPNSTTMAPASSPPLGSPRALAAQPRRVARRATDVAVEPRFVVREGLVERTVSVQAPTDYELRDGFYREGIINYLLLEPQKELRPYAGRRVMVSGYEYLDSRWSTPVLRVRDIQLMP